MGISLRKTYCYKCNKNRNSTDLTRSYILNKTVFSITCHKCDKNNETIVKEEESTEILKFLDLINNIN